MIVGRGKDIAKRGNVGLKRKEEIQARSRCCTTGDQVWCRRVQLLDELEKQYGYLGIAEGELFEVLGDGFLLVIGRR